MGRPPGVGMGGSPDMAAWPGTEAHAPTLTKCLGACAPGVPGGILPEGGRSRGASASTRPSCTWGAWGSPSRDRYTFDTREAVRAAEALGACRRGPVHYDGWSHFRQPLDEAKRVFKEAGLDARMTWRVPGARTPLDGCRGLE
jgi:hypothetical protein